ncbi:MAG: nucleotidyltransferase domain-containing protein [Hylemonella sp.]|nr:nucleotidyltransferase domain-containing protein [Hylemonella sp.]
MPAVKSPESIQQDLVHLLDGQDGLEFSVLVGSRATGKAHEASDWDIALQWNHQLDWLTAVSRTEVLRRQLAEVLRVGEQTVDLIDLRRANLAMRAAVAEEGQPLTGQDGLVWMHFLRRTWRDLEDFYWERQHAA